MASRVSVVIVHGINTDSFGFSKRFSDRLMERLPKGARRYVFPQEFSWDTIFPIDIDRFVRFAGEDDTAGPLRGVREMAFLGLHQAASYIQALVTQQQRAQILQRKLAYQIASQLDNGLPDYPFIFVGHSLGCHIITSFLSRVAGTLSEDLDFIDGKLAGLITFGNNMPIFASEELMERLPPINRPNAGRPAVFPGRKLNQAVRDKAKWINIYSPNDPLGYAVKPLHPEYMDDDRINDVQIKVEGLMPDPLKAHTAYWQNPKVVACVADMITQIVEATGPISAVRA
jgi:hypothetical protein